MLSPPSTLEAQRSQIMLSLLLSTQFNTPSLPVTGTRELVTSGVVSTVTLPIAAFLAAN